VAAGDRVLLVHNKWDGEKDGFAWAEVESLSPEKNPAGKAVTRVIFTAAAALAGAPLAADYKLLRPRLSFRPWQYVANGVAVIDPKGRVAHLETVVRDIHPGDLVLFDVPPQTTRFRPRVGISTEDLVNVRVYLIDLPETSLARVTSNVDVVWYANGVDGNPTIPPNPTTVPPVPVAHSQLSLAQELTGGVWDAPLFLATITVRTGWQPIGPLLPAPVSAFEVKPGTLKTTAGPGFPQAFSGTLVLEGRDGAGALVKATATADGATVAEVVQSPGSLTAPVRAWTGVAPVSRGKTVARELLGFGDATPGQEFVLKNAPLTYLPIPDPSTGRDFTSTLKVWVQDVRWTEVTTFYGRPPGAQVFAAFAGEDGKTRVRFATRLPTGAAVVASYRFGAGATAPAAGALTSVVNPRSGVKGVRNPVRVGGGSDPEPADQVRRYAPQSVLTFGRAVSASDFEAIAARAPGVARAKAVWGFDPAALRGAVIVYVGDDEPAVTNARAAIAAAQDPHRPAAVVLAVPVPIRLTLTAVIDADRQPEPVQSAVRVALLDPDRGVFGTRRVRIGRAVFDSEIASACIAVPGVLAVKSLALTAAGSIPPVVVEPPVPPTGVPACGGHLRSPGEGRFFQLAASDLDVRLEVGRAL
jgi:hypothetical protein